MTDIFVKKYIDEEGNEVTVIIDDNGKIFHCWDMYLPEETVLAIRKTAKELGVEEWEVVNEILETYLEEHEQ